MVKINVLQTKGDQLDTSNSKIEGQRFDKPLLLQGQIIDEPEQYIAEKPYDLTKYEFSVLRRPSLSEFWFNVVAGATAGFVISIAGKVIQSLLKKATPSLEAWELWSIVIGVVFSILIKWIIKSKDEKEKSSLENSINEHFTNHKPRKLHITKRDN